MINRYEIKNTWCQRPSLILADTLPHFTPKNFFTSFSINELGMIAGLSMISTVTWLTMAYSPTILLTAKLPELSLPAKMPPFCVMLILLPRTPNSLTLTIESPRDTAERPRGTAASLIRVIPNHQREALLRSKRRKRAYHEKRCKD